MEEVNFYEGLQNALNIGFSVNYLVLDNFRHVDPSGHQGVFLRGDLFGEKSRQQIAHEQMYRDYGEYRADAFNQLRDYFNSYGFQQCFIQNTNTIVDMYNKVFNQNVKVGDVFSSKEILDISFLKNLCNNICIK